jgi:spermidine synthase
MILLTLLILASGAAGLMYQVLWMRMFGLLLGNTAYAASAVLAGFLLGLGLGYLVVGARRRWPTSPLRLYAWLEVGTGVLAFPIPWILSQGQQYYPEILTMLEFTGSSLAVLMLVKVGVALTILLPAAMCMGGTLPALGDAIVREPAVLGRRGGLVYGCNTAGAMLGGLAAGFWLPVSLGVQHTYMLAVGVNLFVGALAWHLSRQPPFLTSLRLNDRDVEAHAAGFATGRPLVHAETPAGVDALDGKVPKTSPAIWRTGLVFAGVSGFCILGLEVLWTRMFAQVLQNSVYSYAAIVVTVLAALAVSALLVAWSSRYWDGGAALPLTACFAGAATLATPFLFYLGTDGLEYQWTSESWGLALLKLFCLVATVIGPAVILGGMVLPLVWRLWESESDRPGVVVGKTAAVNTFSGVLGALTAGFLLLPALGLWRSIMGLACLWFAAAVWSGLRPGMPSDRRALMTGFLGLVVALSAILWVSYPGAFPLVRLDPKGEQLVEVRESSQGIVAVVDRPQEQDRRLKVDNFYTLGGVAARENALLQGQLPLLLHPDPKRALFIGSATGIPPAGALSFPVEQIIAVELIPEVIDLARRHFREANLGVYDEARVRAVAADGRNFLLSTRDRFDVIVADLFIPWHAGAGSMYSQEQFALASSRLSPDGLFCQWLPLYQLSAQEFRLIVATFLEAFPHTTLWRGDFLAEQPIVALIGHQNGMPISLDELNHRLSRLREASRLSHHVFRDVAGVMMLYAGNLSQAAGRFAGEPINKDDLPLLEYLAPRIVGSGQDLGRRKQWFVGQPLATFYRQLHEEVIELDDPIFRDQTLIHREYRMAGELFYSFNVMTALGNDALAAKVLEQIVDLLPESLYPEQAGGKRL